MTSKSSRCGSVETNLTCNHEDAGSIPGPARRVKDLELLWLWCRPVATVPIQPLVWEHPYAEGVALKGQKKKRKKDDLQIELPQILYGSITFYRAD